LNNNLKKKNPPQWLPQSSCPTPWHEKLPNAVLFAAKPKREEKKFSSTALFSSLLWIVYLFRHIIHKEYLSPAQQFVD